MRFLHTFTVLAVYSTVQAATISAAEPSPSSQQDPTSAQPALSSSAIADPLPENDFDTPKFARPLSISEANAGVNATVTTIHDNIEQVKEIAPALQLPRGLDLDHLSSKARDVDGELVENEKRQSTCSNPRIRVEWDSYPDSARQSLIDAIKCLMRAPSRGPFGQARNRYEDFVALHQTLTPQVHGNAKFLLWHRYYLWAFEDALRTECGFNNNIPWFDETRYAGNFGSSSIFSDRWFGTFSAGGGCVRNGQFASLSLNVGPGSRNVRHCLSRNGDESKTSNTNSDMVNACNGRRTYADMAACAEGGAHAWGHNGIGSVMQDTFAAPGDPVFWLHHAFIDRNFRIWQNSDVGARTTNVGGTDDSGNQLSMGYTIDLSNVRASVRIGDIMNTLGNTLCYKYNY